MGITNTITTRRRLLLEGTLRPFREHSKGGAKNYREVLYQRRISKIDISKEKMRFKADNLSADEALLSRQSLHWMELGVGCLDTNIKLYRGKKYTVPNYPIFLTRTDTVNTV